MQHLLTPDRRVRAGCGVPDCTAAMVACVVASLAVLFANAPSGHASSAHGAPPTIHWVSEPVTPGSEALIAVVGMSTCSFASTSCSD